MRFRWLALVAGILGCSSFGDAEPADGGATDGGPPSGDGGADGAGPDGASDPDADAAPPAGPILHWKMDETSGTAVKDAVGSHDGLVNGPGEFVPGKIGNAFSTVDGTAYVSVANHPSLLVSSQFTLALWLSLAEAPYDAYVYAHGTQFDLKLNARRPQLGVGAGYLNVQYDLPANEWHHITATFDSGTIRIFIDGVEAPQGVKAAGPDAAVPDGNPIVIGRSNSGANAAIGLIDDVRVWNRALSNAEIKALNGI